MSDHPTEADSQWKLAFEGTDPEWWMATGMCGGCGEAECHREMCVGDPCRVCPTRKATGEES